MVEQLLAPQLASAQHGSDDDMHPRPSHLHLVASKQTASLAGCASLLVQKQRSHMPWPANTAWLLTRLLMSLSLRVANHVPSCLGPSPSCHMPLDARKLRQFATLASCIHAQAAHTSRSASRAWLVTWLLASLSLRVASRALSRALFTPASSSLWVARLASTASSSCCRACLSLWANCSFSLTCVKICKEQQGAAEV